MKRPAALLSSYALLSACASVAAPPRAASELPEDVYVISAGDMAAACKTFEMCVNFRTPEVSVIADFEQRLPGLLASEGRRDIAAKLAGGYIRQYWAVMGKDGLEIVGNFVCRSSAVYVPSLTSDEEPIPNEWLARAPVIIDDAGTCSVGVTFPAARPQAAEFSVG